MSLGSFTDTRVEFVRMKGPAGKGYAEMAVSKYQKYQILPSSSQNCESEKSLSKFPSVFKINKSQIKSTKKEGSFQHLNRLSIWDKTFGQAMFWLNKPSEEKNDSFEINDYSEEIRRQSIEIETSGTTSSKPAVYYTTPLNAYLTYVTLKLQIIMQDILEERHKSLLTN